MSLYSRLKRILVGKPIHTKHAHHERLPVIYGLPVFASDALSSVAYATEEILLVLVLAGAMGMSYLMPIALALGVLMLIVGFSYYQTIHAYPQGGGTYLVSTENLGSMAGRVAGAALLIDYILTVAVSVSSAVAAIVSMAPGSHQYGVPIALLAIGFIGLMNLRGAKESGGLFAVPTYTFVGAVIVTVGFAIARAIGEPQHVAPSVFPTAVNEPIHAIGIILVLRAFAASCTALTGTEAIADGVQAFRPPEAKNAAKTLVLMIVLLLTMFLGVSWVADHYAIVPMKSGEPGYMTVLAQIAAKMFGNGSIMFYVVQVATATILFLAANTAFADFPRLTQFIARDGYLPRQLGSIGDRLVFQNGIILLTLLAMGLIVIYHADTHSLIPLYAVGVFISFTMSQSGMVAKWTKARNFGFKFWISLVGALVTFFVTWVLLITKFTEGAWLIAVAISLLLLVFWGIKRHYNYLARELTLSPEDQLGKVRSTVILLVPRMHRGILQAIAYAKSMARDCRAVHVTLDPSSVAKVKEDWNSFGADFPLVILDSPYRSLIEPVTDYIDQALEEDPDQMITVIVPQAVPKHWWQGLLHNNAAVALKLALASRKNVVITNVRYFLK